MEDFNGLFPRLLVPSCCVVPYLLLSQFLSCLLKLVQCVCKRIKEGMTWVYFQDPLSQWGTALLMTSWCPLCSCHAGKVSEPDKPDETIAGIWLQSMFSSPHYSHSSAEALWTVTNLPQVGWSLQLEFLGSGIVPHALLGNSEWEMTSGKAVNLAVLKWYHWRWQMDLKTILLSCGLMWNYVDLGGPAKLEIWWKSYWEERLMLLKP